ncbi:hypothetical protein HanIR_Chr10g0462521 [Helianthus annuus]|nr:hypothetical protein HanIR_Chr10g0462521 [Helianthus annuus]
MVAMTQRSTVWWPVLPFEVEGTGQILTQFHGKIYLNFQLVCSRSRLREKLRTRTREKMQEKEIKMFLGYLWWWHQQRPSSFHSNIRLSL